ncbi:MAG: aspartate aminotransferase family protein [Verrucomicrobiia bacterium]
MRRKTRDIISELRQFESQNVTFVDPDGSWPIIWERAKGVCVWDAEGKKYLDLTAAFGVAAAGHANPAVVRAGQRQMSRLLHAMGDVHPHALKAHLARKLSALTFERWSRRAKGRRGRAAWHGKTIFCNSGFEAVEAALKTALLVTGKRGIIAFRGGYHGLGYGALNATHREHFRRPFLAQLAGFGEFVEFPTTSKDLDSVEASIRRLLRRGPMGAVLVEPVQVRGGINVPPEGFLPMLREVCDESGALLILDEIYTGLGRTGAWFACDHARVAPDVICLGKALTGGFPLAACVGRADLMDAAWPPSTGEAIHTSTFLGHPVGCAMALAQLQQIRSKNLPERAACLGERLMEMLHTLEAPPGLELDVRGIGLLAGVELRSTAGAPATELALRVIKAMLSAGYILLPEGADANVISFTPPLTIGERPLNRAIETLKSILTNGIKTKAGNLGRKAERPIR